MITAACEGEGGGRRVYEGDLGNPFVRTFTPMAMASEELTAPKAQHEVNTTSPRFGTCT